MQISLFLRPAEVGLQQTFGARQDFAVGQQLRGALQSLTYRLTVQQCSWAREDSKLSRNDNSRGGSGDAWERQKIGGAYQLARLLQGNRHHSREAVFAEFG